MRKISVDNFSKFSDEARNTMPEIAGRHQKNLQEIRIIGKLEKTKKEPVHVQLPTDVGEKSGITRSSANIIFPRQRENKPDFHLFTLCVFSDILTYLCCEGEEFYFLRTGRRETRRGTTVRPWVCFGENRCCSSDFSFFLLFVVTYKRFLRHLPLPLFKVYCFYREP